ncbi:MAG: hypothetical protein AAGI48_01775 [Verrucomicrobiota bacterium]
MEEEGSNPYATPQSDLTRLDDPGGWQVRGKSLFFRDGAELPEVDLYSGRDDLPLTKASMEFAVSRSGLGGIVTMILRLAPSVMLIFLIVNRRWDLLPWVAGLVLLAILLRFLPKGKVLRARLRWHVSTEFERRRRRWNTLMSTLVYGALLTMLLGMVLAPPEWRHLGVFLMIGVLVFVRLKARSYPRLWCAKVVDGWFEVNGIPQTGLMALEGRRKWEDAEEDEESERRKVYTARLYRMSLPTLVGRNWWNPVTVMAIIVMKLFRSGRFEREMLHWSEAEELKGSAWDGDLRAKWDELQGIEFFSGWRFLRAQKLDSLLGDQTIQWFTVVSPDDRHSLTVAVVRFVNAANSAEIYETTFRSWLADGVIVLSSNHRLEKLGSPGLRQQHFRGAMEEIASRHLDSLAGEEAIPAGFPDDWRRRMDDEQVMRHQLMEAAGIYGPVREEIV